MPLSFGALLCGVISLSSAPFARTISFLQPNGNSIALWAEGDDFHAVFETLDGYTVIFDPATRAYHYAYLSADSNELLVSGMWVGVADPSILGLSKHLRVNPEAAKAKARARRLVWDQATQTSERWESLKSVRHAMSLTASASGPQAAPPAYTTLGSKVGLCLLIDFDDDPATIPRSEIVNFLNGDNYTGFDNNGSVKQYFLDNSNQKLLYTNVVTIYLRVPNARHPKSYYNDPTKDCGLQGNQLIEDAIAIMMSLPNYYSEILPAFNAVTVNGNNQITAFNVFYAGGNGGVWSRGLWPHSWVLQKGPLPLSPGGKSIYRYQITNIGNWLELGTFCHENGHLLCGFPDLYDYDAAPNGSTGGAGMFCLMNSGGHGGNPVQLCAYLKAAAGWATITELNEFSSASLTLTATAGNNFNHFYQFTKPDVYGTEYFLLENRYASGRDANLPASGVAIWHIDEYGNRDNQSLITNSSHANYEVTLVQADNQWHFESGANHGDVLDLFYAGNTAAQYSNEFSVVSLPSALWWDGTSPRIRFFDISVAGPVMTLQFEKVLDYQLANNELVGWGRNLSGEISFPSGLSNVVAVAGGGEHALALQAGGQVIAWGLNNYGQTNVPESLSNVVAVAAGVEHSLALQADGQVVVWGSPWNDQAQIPTDLTNVVAIAAGAYHNLALKANGQVVGWGDIYTYHVAEIPPGLTNVIAISTSGHHDLALTADGQVVAWGWNDDGQTNTPAGLTNVVAIAAGYYHSLALKSNGEVVAWGWEGAATAPPGLTNAVAIAAAGQHSLALNAQGEIIAWGVDNYQEALSLTGFSNVVAMAAGNAFNLARLSSSRVTYGDRTAQSGESVTLAAPYEVGGSAFIQWYHEGMLMPGATNHWLELNPVHGYQGGHYTAISSFDFGLIPRASINLETDSATVLGRHIFYNNSAWDGNNPAAGEQDDLAIASDKQVLLPSHKATFANYTSYSRGINGIMIDVAALAGSLTGEDFRFKTGNNINPSTWTTLSTTPSISIRQGAGNNGSDRITLIWPDGLITKCWLQVTLLSTANTGLTVPDVFYVGNAVGEAGNNPVDAKVDLMDQQLPRANPRTAFNPAPIDFRYDYNRDKKVDLLDQQLARAHSTTAFNALRLIDLSGITFSP